MKSKIKRKHLLAILDTALNEFENKNPAASAYVTTTVDAWEGAQGTDSDEDVLYLGTTILELVDILQDHFADQVEGLEEDLKTARDQYSELKNRVDRAIDMLNDH